MIRSLVPLRSFLTVVRTGGVRRAASRLSYSPKTVAAHVHRLERVLHVRLLDRSDGDRLVTREGQPLLPYMSDAESAVSDLEHEANVVADERDHRN